MTIVVAGLENAVFAMLPLRFMPGAAVYDWNRRIWIVLIALGLFGFVHVLFNPPPAGYLADTTRTSFLTLLALLVASASPPSCSGRTSGSGRRGNRPRERPRRAADRGRRAARGSCSRCLARPMDSRWMDEAELEPRVGGAVRVRLRDAGRWQGPGRWIRRSTSRSPGTGRRSRSDR